LGKLLKRGVVGVISGSNEVGTIMTGARGLAWIGFPLWGGVASSENLVLVVSETFPVGRRGKGGELLNGKVV